MTIAIRIHTLYSVQRGSTHATGGKDPDVVGEVSPEICGLHHISVQGPLHSSLSVDLPMRSGSRSEGDWTYLECLSFEKDTLEFYVVD